MGNEMPGDAKEAPESRIRAVQAASHDAIVRSTLHGTRIPEATRDVKRREEKLPGRQVRRLPQPREAESLTGQPPGGIARPCIVALNESISRKKSPSCLASISKGK